jgi:hypothetical protein
MTRVPQHVADLVANQRLGAAIEDREEHTVAALAPAAHAWRAPFTSG